MDLAKEKVLHKQFGAGTIIRQSDTKIEVQFGKEYGKKLFLYPSAFTSFLTLSDPALGATLTEEIRMLEEQERARKQAETALREERLRAMMEQREKKPKTKARTTKTAKKTKAVKKAD